MEALEDSLGNPDAIEDVIDPGVGFHRYSKVKLPASQQVDICVLGAWKSGSTSLQSFLRDRYPLAIVEKSEVWHHYKKKHVAIPGRGDTRYWVILRRDTDKTLHSMHKHFFPALTWDEFINKEVVYSTRMTPKQLMKHYLHINWWKKNVEFLTIVYLEDMEKLKGFPKINTKEDRDKRQTPPKVGNSIVRVL